MYEKLPEHDDDPVVTSAPSKGVIAPENVNSSKGTNDIPAPTSTATPNSPPTEQNEPNEPTEPHTTESPPIPLLTHHLLQVSLAEVAQSCQRCTEDTSH